MKNKVIKKQIGEYTYWLIDEPKKTGDWVISKHQIDQQIETSDKFMNGVFNKIFDIDICQCELDYNFNPPMLVSDNNSLSGNALQQRTFKIIKTNNPKIVYYEK